uniref:C-type lectin domain-containing protein n=1 Tax=Acrobeloides nanus TaxID=290746 RepID=A0A914CWY1_9BILA
SVGGQTFFEDTQSCQNNSGNLASIHNDLDNNIVTLYNSFKADYKDTFIGLHQVGENWVWQDGSPYNYSKWYDGVEPSSPKTECVMMEGEYWYGGGELECEIFPALCFSIDGICEKAVQVTPVKHVSEMRQEKKLRISREGLRRKHEKKFDTKKAQKC